jgi:4-amino-4-deoxy-L-arabinose transferase-like glycosyltransferase
MTIRPARSSRGQVAAIIVGLFLFALALRITGIDWGGAHDDENPAAAAKVLTGQLTADQQYYPPLLNYLTAMGYGLLYVLGRGLGWWDSSAAFREAYFIDKTPFLIVARFVVATLSATAAPLAALLALDHQLRRRDAVIVGVLVALMPGAIYWAHIAKSDSGLGPAYLLILLAGFRLFDHIQSRTRAIALGAALVLAVSFKQSAVFFILPIAIILAAAALWGTQRQPLKAVLRAMTITVVTVIALWIPLNIGIVLNPQGFIDAQVVQSQMSVRSADVLTTAHEWLKSVTHAISGIPAVVLIFWALIVGAALVSIKTTAIRFRIVAMATATIVGMVIIAAIAGTRQLPYLYLPYTTLITAALAIAAMSLAQTARPPMKIALTAALLLVGTLFALRAADTLRQTLAPPIAGRLATAITQIAPPGTRILSPIRLDGLLPVSSIGESEDRGRHERLAKKYNVALPPVATESARGAPDGYIVRDYPWVIGGLESVDPDKVKVVLPFAWPLQREEWRLDYWRAQGFTLFVVKNARLFDSPLPAYRDFFRSIRSGCQQVARIDGGRMIFGEEDAMLYRCEPQAVNAASTGAGQ